MDKKDSFKVFARNHPELVTSVKNGDATWQKLYEIYDIYGENNEAWKNYFNKGTNTFGITDIMKNIDVKSIQKHINTAQKALDIVEELTGKEKISPIKGPTTPRPINKFFED